MKTPRQFKRERRGLTDYRKRYKLVKSGLPRLVVRPTSKSGVVQLVEFKEEGDHIIKTITPRTLEKMGLEIKGNSIASFYLMGFAAGKFAGKSGIDEVILDTGRRRMIKGGRISAAVKGYADAGGNIPHDDSILPDSKRLQGSHLKHKDDIKKNFDSYKKKVEEVI
ncbi:MAG: 50S ribosomal protein L18 [Thermoplasmataceae archaeon]|jgi:large subunit ribosomal protein L18